MTDRVSIVIRCHNEVEHIGAVIDEIKSAIASGFRDRGRGLRIN